MKISIIGTGYVGLVTGACLASTGHSVVCLDVDEKKIESLKNGIIPIFEPGLEDLVKSGVESKLLSFTTDKASITDSKVVFLCVGTPAKEDGSADLSYVFQAVGDIAPFLSEGAVVVSKSTVPVGTGEEISKKLNTESGKLIFIASNPEFLREGSAVADFLNPDRIVIGASDEHAFEVLREVYSGFGCNKLETSIKSAEMIKYASNAFLATKISFINEIANICEQTGADVIDVAHGMGLDPRIGKAFLQAGLGYGGSCFPKDVRALSQIAGANGYDFKLLKAVIDVNNDQKWRFYDKVVGVLGGVRGKKIAVLGLAFKAGTDDIRESIGIDYAKKFVEDGARVVVQDAHALENACKVLQGVEFVESIEESVKASDAVIITTDAQEYKIADWIALGDLMNSRIIFDGRNVLSSLVLAELGFIYIRIGN